MHNSIALFDACCELCSGSLRFVMKRDPGRHFRFASIHSEEGKALLGACGFDPDHIGGLVLVQETRCLQKSDAVPAIAGTLEGFWRNATLLRFVPVSVRDWTYDLVAKNRYRFWRRKSCPIPFEDDHQHVG